jgi:putative modified peptide
MATRKQSGDGIDPELAATLMDKLASDDAFRSAFQADPHGALESLGWKRPPGHKKAAPIKKLASKEQIAQTRDGIEDKLCTSMPFAWPECCDEFSAEK